MAAPLVERSTGDIIPASDHNDVKDYIEDGTYRVNTLSLNIGGTEIIDSSGNITTNVGTVDGIDIATDVAANTLKVTNATHTGEVTGSGALTIADNVIDEANMKISNAPTNDYVLTADSGATGGWKWAEAAAGDPMWEATVGATGADYTTLGAAIADSKTRILVIDDTTETGNITLSSNTFIKGIGQQAISIDMGAYGINASSAYSVIEDLTIVHTGVLFENPIGLTCNRVTVDNNATTSSMYDFRCTSTSVELYLNDCILEQPNQGYCGISVSSVPDVFINNLTIIGGGTNCYIALTGAKYNLNGLNIKGIFHATVAAISTATNANLTNIYNETAASISFTGGLISNFTNYVASTLTLDSNSIVTNIKDSGGMNIILNGHYNILNNVKISGNLTINASKNRNQICNSVINGAVSIDGDGNIMNGCRVGADAGSGSNTITIVADADRTLISGCRCDAAISDSGTDSQIDYAIY